MGSPKVLPSVTVVSLHKIEVKNSLSLLLAETPHKIARGKLSGQQFTSRLSVGVPLQMLSNRPDVRMAERDLEQAFYVTNQAN